MGSTSSIEWTDASWTPIRARIRTTGKVGWHCVHMSEGCRNCYAEGINKRLGTGLAYKPGHLKDIEIFLDETMLLAPLRWRKPRKVFVCSMTDLFGDFVPDEMIDRVFAVMALAPQHTFQLLTKRPERMRDYLGTRAGDWNIVWPDANPPGSLPISRHEQRLAMRGAGWPDAILRPTFPLPNVWLGTSAEDQPAADARIPELLATPAAVRFVSLEPMLGPIDLERVGTLASIRAAMPGVIEREERGRPTTGDGSICNAQIDAVGSSGSSVTFFQTPDHMGGFTTASPRKWPRLDLVICGGESGPHARPMHPDWARSLRDQCFAAGVPFFFKQWGEWAPHRMSAGCDLGGDVRAGRVRVVHPSGRSDVEISTATGGYSSEPGSRYMARVGKNAAGRILDGRTHDEFPAVRT